MSGVGYEMLNEILSTFWAIVLRLWFFGSPSSSSKTALQRPNTTTIHGLLVVYFRRGFPGALDSRDISVLNLVVEVEELSQFGDLTYFLPSFLRSIDP